MERVTHGAQARSATHRGPHCADFEASPRGGTGITLAEAAAWYASRDLPVFPLKPRDKTPATQHGLKDASSDTGRVAAWWRELPEANMGIPTGAASGLLAVDLDPRNGGPAEREDCIRGFGPCADTAEQITGGGFRPLLFRWLRGSVPSSLRWDIDLKADGGYVVAAQSIHLNLRAYQRDGPAGAQALLTVADRDTGKPA